MSFLEEIQQKYNVHNVKERLILICPECGSDMILRSTDKYKCGNGKNKKFYSCINFPDCDGIHGAHPNGKPHGVPANKETREWRMKAHDVFDQLWLDREAGYSRSNAYKCVSKVLGYEMHISNLGIEGCKSVIKIVNKIFENRHLNDLHAEYEAESYGDRD